MGCQLSFGSHTFTSFDILNFQLKCFKYISGHKSSVTTCSSVSLQIPSLLCRKFKQMISIGRIKINFFWP